jgi:hypothetical protein
MCESHVKYLRRRTFENTHSGEGPKRHFLSQRIVDNFFRALGAMIKLAESRRSLVWALTKKHFPLQETCVTLRRLSLVGPDFFRAIARVMNSSLDNGLFFLIAKTFPVSVFLQNPTFDRLSEPAFTGILGEHMYRFYGLT